MNPLPIIVVSGLPRSGTSLMMQILREGGVPILEDKHRLPDENNPRGYLELEQVKRLAADNSWVGQACGRAIKVVAHLIPFLPNNFNYKIIYMHRDLDEIVESQTRMLAAQGMQAHQGMKDALGKMSERALTYIQGQSNMSSIDREYLDLIQNPLETCKGIDLFLGMSLDLKKMTASVDPSLYRNRKH